MSGGFIIPASGSSNTTAQPIPDFKPKIPADVQPLLALTPRQENRLRIHIDGKLGELERDSKTHGFKSLPLLIARLSPLLQLILQIPPIEPWSSLRNSYLLSYTGSVVGYITSLSLVAASSSFDQAPQTSPDSTDIELVQIGSSSREETASRNLRSVLDLLAEVDRGWRAVLRGEGWVMDQRSGRGKPKRVGFAGQVGLTERIRLRSIIISSRAKLLAWARSYGTFPGSSFPSGGKSVSPSPSSGQDRRAHAASDEWETEVMGMWNGVLDTLSRDSLTGGRDDEDDDDDQEAADDL